jgi:hypothetical protein
MSAKSRMLIELKYFQCKDHQPEQFDQKKFHKFQKK